MNSIFRLLLRAFTKLFTIIIPRDERIWVIGSWFGKRYADNSRYFYEYLNDNQQKYKLKKIIWVTDEEEIIEFIRNSERLAYKKKSFMGFYYHLRAKVFFYDQNTEDLNYDFTHGALRIHLWHGIPLKNLGHHYKAKSEKSCFYQALFKLLKPLRSKNRDFIVEPSEFSGKILSSAFGSKTIPGPYPRNEYLIGSINSYLTTQEQEYFNILKDTNKKIIFYLPTFRDKCDLKFLGTTDIEKQDKVISELGALGYILITKVHYAGSSNLEQKPNVNLINLPSNMDVYPFLKITDILITDYSSVSFDFLYLDREIVFLAYDLEYYKNEDRGLILDYDKYAPGEKVYDTDSIIQTITKIKNKKIDYSAQRLAIKNEIFSNNSLSDFVDRLKRII
jgi:CDP-glycerol glycerophosphotransferase (TagB/SpsB family)